MWLGNPAHNLLCSFPAILGPRGCTLPWPPPGRGPWGEFLYFSAKPGVFACLWQAKWLRAEGIDFDVIKNYLLWKSTFIIATANPPTSPPSSLPAGLPSLNPHLAVPRLLFVVLMWLLTNPPPSPQVKRSLFFSGNLLSNFKGPLMRF